MAKSKTDESRFARGVRSRSVFLFASSAMAWGCGSTELSLESTSNDEAIALQDAQIVLSLESLDGWRANNDSLDVESVRVQGSGALAVTVQTRTTLTSAPFEFTKTPNAVQLSLRGPLAGGKAVGTVSASLRCNELGVKREVLPAQDMSRLHHDANGFARVHFGVPEQVQNALAGGCPRLVVVLEVETARPGRFVLDDLGLRADTPPITVESAPLCGLKGKAELVARAVEMPEGHWDYQGWLASPAVQAELPLFHEIVSAHHDVVLGVLPDHAAQQAVVVVDSLELDRGAVQQGLEAARIGLPIRIQPSCHPINELRALRAQIESGSWAEGTPAWAGYLDAEFGRYVLTMDPGTPASDEEVAWNLRRAAGLERVRNTAMFRVTEKTARLAESIQRRFGDALSFRWGRAGTRGRLNDGQPHYGAAGIGTGTNFCTSGFVVTRDGVRGSVTAGHCFKTNGTVIKSSTLAYGSSAGIAPNPTYDMTRIAPGNQLFTNTIHTDPGQATRVQVGKADPLPLQLVCVSGMVTRAKCSIEVLDDFCSVFTPNFGTTHNLTRGVRDGVTIGQSGDSGAPVYRQSGAVGAIIVGMEVGGAVDDEICFHKVSTIETQLGVQVAL